MNDYDRGWKECALFLCNILDNRAKGWRAWNNTLTNAIAEDYEITISYILEKQVENHKQIQPPEDDC